MTNHGAGYNLTVTVAWLPIETYPSRFVAYPV